MTAHEVFQSIGEVASSSLPLFCATFIVTVLRNLMRSRAESVERNIERSDDDWTAKVERMRATKGFARIGVARKLYEKALALALNGDRKRAIAALKVAHELDADRREIVAKLAALENAEKNGEPVMKGPPWMAPELLTKDLIELVGAEAAAQVKAQRMRLQVGSEPSVVVNVIVWTVFATIIGGGLALFDAEGRALIWKALPWIVGALIVLFVVLARQINAEEREGEAVLALVDSGRGLTDAEGRCFRAWFTSEPLAHVMLRWTMHVRATRQRTAVLKQAAELLKRVADKSRLDEALALFRWTIRQRTAVVEQVVELLKRLADRSRLDEALALLRSGSNLTEAECDLVEGWIKKIGKEE